MPAKAFYYYQPQLLDDIFSQKNKTNLIKYAKKFSVRSNKSTKIKDLIINIFTEASKLFEGREDVFRVKSSFVQKVLGYNKAHLIKRATKSSVKNVNKMTAKALKKEIILKKSKTIVDDPQRINNHTTSAVYFGPITFEESFTRCSEYDPAFFRLSTLYNKERYFYSDPQMPYNRSNPNNYQKDFNDIFTKLLNSDVASIIVDFLTFIDGPVGPVYSMKESQKITEKERSEIDEHTRLHNKRGHYCTYETCMNVFKKSLFYNITYKTKPRKNKKEPTFWDTLGDKLYPKVVKDSYVENMRRGYDSFDLVPGWYSQVIPIKSGNCLKDSLFKMRELILNEYAPILKNIKFGAINNYKEFTELSNSLDDHDISSLDYFPYLLSTRSVYFINRKGQMIYRSVRGSRIDIPVFYKVFFLIEDNNDGLTGHISPINFGIMNKAIIPSQSFLTKIKKLYGKDPWLEPEFKQYFNSVCEMKINLDKEKKLKVQDNLRIQKVKHFSSKSKIIYKNQNLRRFFRKMREHGEKAKLMINETDVSQTFRSIIGDVFYNNPEYWKMDTNPEKNGSNFYDSDFKIFETLNLKEHKNLENSHIEEFYKSRGKACSFDSKRLDNAVCYNLQNLKSENGKYKVLLLIEYKDVGLLKPSTLAQVVFYHLFMNLDCKYLLVSTIYNNIVLKHSLKETKKNEWKHVYEIIYNDTEYLDKGISSEKIKYWFENMKADNGSCTLIKSNIVQNATGLKCMLPKVIGWSRTKNDAEMPLPEYVAIKSLKYIMFELLKKEYEKEHEKHGKPVENDFYDSD